MEQPGPGRKHNKSYAIEFGKIWVMGRAVWKSNGEGDLRQSREVLGHQVKKFELTFSGKREPLKSGAGGMMRFRVRLKEG